ncbi:MAG TPA: hypothetical protein VL547_06665 [Dinghuibacter sp.]|uniref:hypothetical protein n=1 Tax=Dinghuibacter sp. TaxID=2024697 RepID=UPI002CF458A0|nr:hypothetical protein [Dinghuibacter sp.]HTJ11686.1 hypothetical protein [Dinghuibacter sp.]
MKKPIMNNTLRAAATLFLSGLFFLHAGATKAQSHKDKADAVNPVNVTYIGSQDGNYIFDVAFDNNAGDTYYVAVVDDAGNTLYKGLYTDKKFDKKFKLPPGEEINSVSFVIRNLKSNSSYTYAVAAQQRSVEEVSVKRTN